MTRRIALLIALAVGLAARASAQACTAAVPTRVIQFMTNANVPANQGTSLGAYKLVRGCRYINFFVRFSQDSAQEAPVDLGFLFAFSSNGEMGSRRYVNLESNVASPQATNFIEVSGAGSWHGAQWRISSYAARSPVMAPYVQVFVYNRASVARSVTVWAYASQ